MKDICIFHFFVILRIHITTLVLGNNFNVIYVNQNVFPLLLFRCQLDVEAYSSFHQLHVYFHFLCRLGVDIL